MRGRGGWRACSAIRGREGGGDEPRMGWHPSCGAQPFDFVMTGRAHGDCSPLGSGLRGRRLDRRHGAGRRRRQHWPGGGRDRRLDDRPDDPRQRHCRGRGRPRKGASPAGIDRRRADPAELWPDAGRGPGHLGHPIPRKRADDHPGRQGRRHGRRHRRRWRRPGGARVFVHHLVRRGVGRGADRAHRPDLGRRQAAGSGGDQLPALSRRRGAAAGSEDRGCGGRGPGACLSRTRLHRLRRAGSRALRQPHSAAERRGLSRAAGDPGRARVRPAAVRARARRLHLAGLGRVRARPPAGARCLPGRGRQVHQRQQRLWAARLGGRDGSAGRRAAELQRRFAGRGLVRQRPARGSLPGGAAH